MSAVSALKDTIIKPSEIATPRRIEEDASFVLPVFWNSSVFEVTGAIVVVVVVVTLLQLGFLLLSPPTEWEPNPRLQSCCGHLLSLPAQRLFPVFLEQFSC